MSKLIPSATEVYISQAPEKCDLCHRGIGSTFCDAYVPGFAWANVCPPCFKAHGCKLGTGKGQAYKLVDGFWRKLVPATEAKPSRKRPSERTLEKWSMDGVAKAQDGCRVEPDGVCSHGSKSWLLALGLV